MVNIENSDLILQENIIIAFASYSECRDRATVGHLKRVSKIAELLSSELSHVPRYKAFLSKENIQLIKCASMMHDLGKIYISEAILLKPGPLNSKEYDEMKYHVFLDDMILNPIRSIITNEKLLLMVLNVVKYHHENYDGTGYITGAKGDQIPLEAQIAAVADVYDAIRSRRCYKDEKTHDHAKKIILSYRHNKFSSELVDAFIKVDNVIQGLYN